VAPLFGVDPSVIMHGAPALVSTGAVTAHVGVAEEPHHCTFNALVDTAVAVWGFHAHSVERVVAILEPLCCFDYYRLLSEL
jgi:hypothetical protein